MPTPTPTPTPAPTPTWTPEKQTQLDQLQNEQRQAGWQERENDRVAQLALFQVLNGTFDATIVEAQLTALNTLVLSVTDLETRDRIMRLMQILSSDGRQLINKAEALKMPQPRPGDLPPSAPPEPPAPTPPEGGEA